MDQHWVPRCYLNAWCDPECPIFYTPYLHVFRRDGTSLGQRAPKNLFAAADFYTISLDDGRQDLRLEHGLATIEDEFARLRPKIELREGLTSEESGWLLAFVAAAHVRTPKMSAHQHAQFGKMLRVMDDLNDAMKEMSPMQKERFASAQPPSVGEPTLSHDRVREIVSNPMQTTLLPLLTAELKAFAAVDLKLGILYHDGDPGFVTSDTPCVWFDPATVNAPPLYRGVGVASATVEITLPISPRLAVILSHHSEFEGYIPAIPKVLHEINRRTISNCQDKFVSYRSAVHPSWVIRQ